MIIDAGSSDGTLEYLRSIEDSRVRVEVLKGSRPYEAVDWGFKHTTGDILAWLNGDDLYYPGTISCVAQLFAEFPDVDWITGQSSFVNAEGQCTVVGNLSSYPKRYIENGWFSEFALGNMVQESMFWRRSLYEKAGGLNLDYDQAADFELWTRFARNAPLVSVSTLLAAWRKHGNNRSLTGTSDYLRDVARATADLPRMNWFKRWLCKRTATKHALRLLEWHRTPWIYFSMTASKWMRGTAFRPISRYGFQNLWMEFRAARRRMSSGKSRRSDLLSLSQNAERESNGSAASSSEMDGPHAPSQVSAQ
jgi:glycosyltransferase involved in cell wall biosynthesis